MNFKAIWLVNFLVLISPFFSNANVKQVATPIDIEFLQLVPNAVEGNRQQIAVSESQGIKLLNEDLAVVAQIQQPAEHLDYRQLPNALNKGVVTTLDTNTGELLFIEIDHKQQQLDIKQRFKPKNSAIDALCLSAASHGIDIFTVDVLGQVVHYNVYQAINQVWQLTEITRFPVGPNVKSCAVSENAESLYIVEENIGIWRYSSNPEHERTRELIQLEKGLEVEYVDTTEQGDVAIVSPDKNVVWLWDQANKQLTQEKLPKNVAPKTVQVTRMGDTLVTNLYDDNSKRILSVQIEQVGNTDFPQAEPVESLLPYGQTESVLSFGDAADDPEIWVNKQTPEASLVYTTDKKYGLNVYDLSGKLVTSLPVGRINNIDIRYDVMVNGKSFDIAAASNRTSKSISVFAIDKITGLPTHLTNIKTDLTDPYGFCLSKHQRQITAWINDTDGRFQRYDFQFNGDTVTAEKTLEWTVASQPEGCVSDDETQRLFYGEEAKGVWLKHIDNNTPDKFIAGLHNEIAADIEGMSLYQYLDKHYLVVSSQGNNRYSVYAIDNQYKYLGVFEVGANWPEMIDGASETDGLAVTSQFLGAELPNGLLVVQDGHNVMPQAAQNFKLVSGSLLREWIAKRVPSI
ncbi:phytase [Colwellia sp. 1_MG-2023]|uniref:phytase n=1 Tax=Colwellia sp. 1_MG-2023 TaxID=3062649 RepID=UPI0026E13FF1|nr:phytase [Colwellia sp. 1_MG-2023]